MSAPLVVDDLWWKYPGGSWLLRDVTFSVAAGQVLRVVGGNGSGKSTLLGLLAGCAAPRRGRVQAHGPVGYLPQLARAMPAVRTGRLVTALTGASPRDPVLMQHASARADELSGGTTRRLLLEAVLALDARALVLDEPAAGLDATAIARLVATLRERTSAGCAVVVADHEELAHVLPADDVLDLGGLDASSHLIRVVLRDAGGRVTEELVAPQECDAHLLRALTSGCSVIAVERAT